MKHSQPTLPRLSLPLPILRIGIHSRGGMDYVINIRLRVRHHVGNQLIMQRRVFLWRIGLVEQSAHGFRVSPDGDAEKCGLPDCWARNFVGLRVECQ